jgi:hypothetical protein|tara:strand:+ start:1348 stop:1653 length:306 start_codon:yes stop_codon:yes gene_type:complete
MSEYETKLRERFGLPSEGKLCATCLSKLEDRVLIDNVLEMNARAQTSLGTDATEKDRSIAYHVARHAKTVIAQSNPKMAEVCFPEIDLKELSPLAYLGEKL